MQGGDIVDGSRRTGLGVSPRLGSACDTAIEPRRAELPLPVCQASVMPSTRGLAVSMLVSTGSAV